MVHDSVESFRLSLPISGSHGRDWVVSYYVDHGGKDYRGGPRTYSGHDGTDFIVPTFRAMDYDRIEILATADGEVFHTDDGHPDRSEADGIERLGPRPPLDQPGWNVVEIKHPNGYRTIYGHMKKGSVKVCVGEQVSAGDTLGIIGSSGWSTGPHLRFAVKDDVGGSVDPFMANLWHYPPDYVTPLGLMDYCVLGPRQSFQRRSPAYNLIECNVEEPVLMVVYLAGVLRLGQWLKFSASGPGRLFRIDDRIDSIRYNGSISQDSWWSCVFPPIDRVGKWNLNVWIDDTDLRVNHRLIVRQQVS